MKKLFALLLVFAMIFATLPFTAFASEATSMQSQLTIKACNAFPEYANKIRAQEQQIAHNQLSVLSNQSKDVIINETRDISDTESITYTEFSDGMIMLTGLDVEHSVTEVDESYAGSRITYTVNIFAKLVGYPDCNVTMKNVKYTINRTGYDRFVSSGTSSRGSKCSACNTYITRTIETDFSPAEMVADINYLYGNSSAGDYCITQMIITLQNDRRSISYQVVP